MIIFHITFVQINLHYEIMDELFYIDWWIVNLWFYFIDFDGWNKASDRSLYILDFPITMQIW